MESLANHFIAAIGRTEIGPWVHLGRRFNCWCRNQHVLWRKDQRGLEVYPYPQPLQRSLKISRIFIHGMDPKMQEMNVICLWTFVLHVGRCGVGLTLLESFLRTTCTKLASLLRHTTTHSPVGMTQPPQPDCIMSCLLVVKPALIHSFICSILLMVANKHKIQRPACLAHLVCGSFPHYLIIETIFEGV